MPSINKCIVFLALALGATAISSGGHVVRNQHRGLARNGGDILQRDMLVEHNPLKKRSTRSNSKRCKAAATTTSTTKTSTTHKPTATKAAKPAPAEETSSHDDPTTTKKSDPSPTSGGGGGGLTKGGISTYFTQNGNAGACGKVHPDSAVICAIDSAIYDGGSHCGDSVLITNLKNGKTLSVVVADECPTCENAQSIDLSEGAFFGLGGTVDEGEFPIAWKWA